MIFHEKFFQCLAGAIPLFLTPQKIGLLNLSGCPERFTWNGENCECESNWFGENCDECAIGWTGEFCDQCELGYYGENCRGIY